MTINRGNVPQKVIEPIGTTTLWIPELLSDETLVADGNFTTISGIDQSYDDLLLTGILRHASSVPEAGVSLDVVINVLGTNANQQFMSDNGIISVINDVSRLIAIMADAALDAGEWTEMRAYFIDYSSSRHKIVRARFGGLEQTAPTFTHGQFIYRTTATDPIESIAITTGGGSSQFESGSNLKLYGLKNQTYKEA